jgi:UDP-glucose 4-epimerase
MAVFLVTGGAGFIGSSLVEALVERGDKVRVYDDFSTGRRTNLQRVEDRIEIVAGNLSDRELLSKAASGAECVFHFAISPVSIGYSLQDAPGSWANSTDTLNLLTVARNVGVRRVVYASSGGVYGHPNALQMKESDPVLPLSPTDYIELTGEHLCVAFSTLYGLETVRLRYFDVFGPRQSPSSAHASAIPVILKAMLAGQSPVLTDNVHRYHDFLYVDDAVHAALLAAEEKRATGKAYNIARGRPVNLLEVVAAVNEIRNTNIDATYSQRGAGDFQPQSVSVIKAEAELGFCARTDLKQGLTALMTYYTNQLEHFRADAPESPSSHRHDSSLAAGEPLVKDIRRTPPKDK